MRSSLLCINLAQLCLFPYVYNPQDELVCCLEFKNRRFFVIVLELPSRCLATTARAYKNIPCLSKDLAVSCSCHAVMAHDQNGCAVVLPRVPPVLIFPYPSIW